MWSLANILRSLTLLLMLRLPTSMSVLAPDCTGESLLDTPFFSSYKQADEPAVGCGCMPLKDDIPLTHLLTLKHPAQSEVELKVTGVPSRGLVLLLDSGNPVTWKLSLTGVSDTLVPALQISPGSIARDPQGRPLKYHELRHPNHPLATNETLKSMARVFLHITTYTTVETANIIHINLPQDNSDCVCDLDSTSASKAVRAATRVRQSLYGCLDPNPLGTSSQDVYVVDLKSEHGLEPPQQRLNKRDAGEPAPTDNPRLLSPPPTVEVDLSAYIESGGGGGAAQPSGADDEMLRNLSLILRSDKPVTWKINSQGINGNVLIATGDNKVEHLTDDSSQHFQVDNSVLPDRFADLMHDVRELYGEPLSYLRVYKANLLQLQVPSPRSKRESQWSNGRDVSSLMRPGSDSVHQQQPPLSPFPSPATVEDIVGHLRSVLVKHCEISLMSVVLPVSAISPLVLPGLNVSLTLNDPTCVLVNNGTHYVGSSHSTACGSTALTYGNSPMYRNNVVLRGSIGDAIDEEIRVPFICKFKPGIPGISPGYSMSGQGSSHNGDSPDDVAEEALQEAEPDFGQGDEMYDLRVNLVLNDTLRPLLSRKQDSTLVALGDELQVQSNIDAIRYLALAIEQCWLSPTSRVTPRAGPGHIRLVMAGCPAQDGVSMHWDSTSANAAFSFKVTEEMLEMREAWIQCRMGLCSSTSAGAQGNINRCEDPAESCRSSKPHRESPVQQLTVRGPLHVLPVSREALDKAHMSSRPPGGSRLPTVPTSSDYLDPVIPEAKDSVDNELPEDSEDDSSDSSHPPTTTLVGVTVEVAAAISVASFLVGALSTGVLWLLYNKALTAKSVQTGGNGECGELQSMLSPGHNSIAHYPNTSINNNANYSGLPVTS